LHKIEELATLDPAPAPQESIFDADGWCYDLKSIPKDTLIDLCVQSATDKSIVNREVNCLLSDDTYEEGYVIIAWRPLPKLPNTDTTKNLNKGE
jgi:hypothetical protein